tara:strand:- start:309 stop:980 length:672 start_codon:yes stop_codon:yes gene_type:complete
MIYSTAIFNILKIQKLSILLFVFIIACNSHKQQLETFTGELPRDSLIYLSHALEEVGKEDQVLRRLMGCARERFGIDSEEMKTFYKVLAKLDSQNVVSLSKMVDERGWLGISDIGVEANKSQWLIIQHAKIDLQEKYLPLLRESFNKNESNGSHLAMLEDRILIRKGKKQIYGTQVKMDPKNGKWYLHPIKDSLNVDKRRHELGMQTLTEYMNEHNIEFNKPN